MDKNEDTVKITNASTGKHLPKNTMSRIVTLTEPPNNDEKEEIVVISTTIPQQQATIPPIVAETKPSQSNANPVNFII